MCRIKPVFPKNKKSHEAQSFLIGTVFAVSIILTIGVPDPRSHQQLTPAFLQESTRDLDIKDLSGNSFRTREDVVYKLRFNEAVENFFTADSVNLSEASLAYELFRNLDLQFVDHKLGTDGSRLTRFISSLDATEYLYRADANENSFFRVTNSGEVKINSFADDVASYLKGEKSLPYRFVPEDSGLIVMQYPALENSVSGEFPINFKTTSGEGKLSFYR